MRQLLFSDNKTLKLNNVLIYDISFDNSEEQLVGIDTHVLQMQNYAKSKGANTVGPLIQHTNIITVDDNSTVEVKLMIQLDRYLHNVEKPFMQKSVIKVPNCCYCRYIGPEEEIQIAYSKIHVESFVKGIKLNDETYTIFVSRDIETDDITSDVFIKKLEENC